MSAHPNLKGLIGITPTEALHGGGSDHRRRTRSGRSSPPGTAAVHFERPAPRLGPKRRRRGRLCQQSGKLGYLTVWAANYLLTGHHFKPGAYQVGGPIGLVWYYANHRELRLGQPLTITKANVDLYANKF